MVDASDFGGAGENLRGLKSPQRTRSTQRLLCDLCVLCGELRLGNDLGARLDPRRPIQSQMSRGALSEPFAAHAVTIGVFRFVIDRRADVHAANDFILRKTDEAIDVRL